ncbi:MAG: DUF4105 domain-containing protein [Bacteroidetes bacterium]|nr:DUF4105 domain-containing protein [Bacteroidota bacterium]
MLSDKLFAYFAAMFRVLILFFTALFITHLSFAQTDTSHLRISLLTCGTGVEPWETFGHTAIRVTDSTTHQDIVYNYGTFAFGEDFLLQFTQGKLLYYLSFYPFENFVQEYAQAKRSITEQELHLPGIAKSAVYEYLTWNAMDEHKYYKYDFFLDNCATRIRDVFQRALGASFQFGNALPKGQSLTYRQLMNQYFYRVHWQRFGVNLLLGSKIDKVMTNDDCMFLPDCLQQAVSSATYKSQRVAGSPVLVLDAPKPLPAGINQPLLLTLAIALLTMLGLVIPGWKKLGQVMTFLLLFLSGFIGCFILMMWFATDHQACQNNYNLLWALPTNLVLAFAPKRKKCRYTIIATILLVISLLLHFFHVQQLPILELSPLLIALVAVYVSICKKGK